MNIRRHPFPRSRRLADLALLLILIFAASVAGAADPVRVRIAYLGATETDPWRGARQGITEANAQGKFLGYHYELVTATDESDALALSPAVIVADVAPLRLLRLAEMAGETAVINVTAADDELREACTANLLHTIPSLAMHADALLQWQRKAPESSAESRAWHPTFRKYAAAQLNKRYSESFGQAMSDEAWAGWAAVKLVSDTIVRISTAAPEAVHEAVRDDLAFDGQKGIDMSFRNTGQLRQPLLLVENDKIVGEAPVRGIVGVSNLDSLGLADCLK